LLQINSRKVSFLETLGLLLERNVEIDDLKVINEAANAALIKAANAA